MLSSMHVLQKVCSNLPGALCIFTSIQLEKLLDLDIIEPHNNQCRLCGDID